MINRELIRIKVVQIVYAYYQNSGTTVGGAEKEILFSLSKAYELYNNLLLLIVTITKEERNRINIQTRRALREGLELPSCRFVDNKFAEQLTENTMLLEFAESGKGIWDDNIDLVRKLCSLIESSDVYKEYMEADDNSYEADREVWRRLYRQIIQDNADIDEALEERSLYWNDDKSIIDTFVLKTIRRFEAETTSDQKLLPMYKEETDRDFACRLLRATLDGEEEYRGYISESSENWDLRRLALMDVVLLQTAIAEMLTFSSIPVNVTMSEYVELAKVYSTPRSASFINGVLDNIAHNLVSSGRLLKTVK